MADRLKVPIEDIKAIVEMTGEGGEWSEHANGQWQYRAANGAILNWWCTKGTISYQGPQGPKDEFSQLFKLAQKKYLSADSNIASVARVENKRIFIVHGHDSDARDQLELALHRLGLKPFILMNTSGGGKTIVEALEGQIGSKYQSAFGIVLLTPDDIGYVKTDGSDKAEPRARQNVILETGMLLSSLTREKMVLLVKGHLELPSDLQGIIYYGFNDHIREIIPKLCQRLGEVGFIISPADISAAST